jgi:hypothetical protein
VGIDEGGALGFHVRPLRGKFQNCATPKRASEGRATAVPSLARRANTGCVQYRRKPLQNGMNSVSRHTTVGSRGALLVRHKLDDLTDRVQVLDARLVRLDSNPEVLFQENDQLEGPDRIEDASGD